MPSRQDQYLTQRPARRVRTHVAQEGEERVAGRCAFQNVGCSSAAGDEREALRRSLLVLIEVDEAIGTVVGVTVERALRCRSVEPNVGLVSSEGTRCVVGLEDLAVGHARLGRKKLAENTAAVVGHERCVLVLKLRQARGGRDAADLNDKFLGETAGAKRKP